MITRTTSLADLCIRYTARIPEYEPDPTDLQVRVVHEALSALLDACPGLVNFELEISLLGSLDERATPLVRSLRKLEKLKEMTLSRLRPDQSWNICPWPANLTLLELEDVDGLCEDFLRFLGHFGSSLTKLEISFSKDMMDQQAFPDIPDTMLPIKVKELQIRTCIPRGVVDFFLRSPLRFVELYPDSVAESAMLDAYTWRRLLRDHQSTLVGVYSYHLQLTEEEKEELDAMAVEYGVGLDLTIC